MLAPIAMLLQLLLGHNLLRQLRRASRLPTLSVVSLNVGDCTSNPLEFILAGDETATGQQTTELHRVAEEAMVDSGPEALDATERVRVNAILDSIYARTESSGRGFVDELLRSATWASVYRRVQRDKPELFNAFNLMTLNIGRPAVLEAPAGCAHPG